ncbi:Wzz/FepE/Etk N-terminal domain-containing protein [Gammaproteobacteria bacterium]|nr:Wzz/FepE/Etk N-terminal domain-containing protein [Gammaproteobacteria bacterium]
MNDRNTDIQNNFNDIDALVIDRDAINLDEVIQTIFNSRKFIAIVTSIFCFLSIIVSLMLPNIYTANALLKPTDSEANSSLMSSVGGLAKFAGVSMPSSKSNDSDLALKMLKSRLFFSNFIEKRSVLPDLMAAKSWNSQTQEVSYRSNLYSAKDSKWKLKSSSGTSKKPTNQEAHDEFLKILNISQDRKSLYITIEVDHISPIVAKNWITWLIEDVNIAISDIAIKEADSSIKYLESQIASTPFAELRTMFYEIIQQHTQTMVLAKVRPEYAITTVDPAVAPETKSKPSRSVIVVLATILSLILAIFWSLFTQNRSIKLS